MRKADPYLRLKLSVVVFFATLAQLILAYVLYQRSQLLGSIFVISALASAIGGAVYLFFLQPYFLKRHNKALSNEKMSLTDLVEWKLSGSEFRWPHDYKIRSRDWAVFLESSPLQIKASHVAVLVERPVMIGDDVWLVAYVRCEETSFDKHIAAFEGWIAHAPELRDDISFSAQFNRHSLIGVTLAAFAVFGLVGGLISPKLRKLDAGGLALIAGVMIALLGCLSVACTAVLAKAKYSRGHKALPLRYQGIYERLAEAREVLLFRIASGPSGLLIAAQPKESHPQDDHLGVVALESQQGATLETILNALKDLYKARAA
jgi:hypothetical protein